MAELVEYTLAVMVSALFVAGSVAVYGNFSSFQSGLSLRAEFEAVSGLASKAVQNGSARASMSLPPSTIACRGGILSVAVAGASLNESLPLGCAFTVAVPGGVHTLSFTDGSSGLGLTVT